jgi:hypothetical protein
LPIDNGAIVTLPLSRAPRATAQRAQGKRPMEADARDMAILGTMILLIVLTMQVLWLTNGQRSWWRRR